MRKLLVSVLGCTLLIISGCATIFNGSTQTVNIRSNDALAKLYVNEEYMGQHNAVYTFKKKDNYIIKAEKMGCQTTTITPKKVFDPTTLLGVFLDWGIVSIFVIDGAATGAWQKFTQTNFVIDPNC